MPPNQDASSRMIRNGKIQPIWNIGMSEFAKSTANPHRLMAENSKIIPNPSKSTITLQMGDPTIFGNFARPIEAVEAIKTAVERDKFSYYHTMGIVEARQAVADYVNKSGLSVSTDDVILTSGGSSSLEMCFQALANAGENILIPRPCFNYKTWLCGPAIEARSYNLDPTNDWAIDLKHLESQIDRRTRAILINNVGNPCGNVFTRDHLLEILKVAEKHRLPIISDDIYEFFVFPGVTYHPIATLAQHVPIISCSGLTKRFIMPGIRMGWVVIHDPLDQLHEVRQGLVRISGRNFGPNSTVQLALSAILTRTPESFFTETSQKVYRHALLAYNSLKDVRGLKPVMPQGAFYMMTKIELNNFPEISSCLEFVENLAKEQSVLAFPGPCFDFPGYFRFVLTIPEEMIAEACSRIREFCDEHFVETEEGSQVVDILCRKMSESVIAVNDAINKTTSRAV